MTKEDFKVYTDQTITKLLLYARLHTHKDLPEKLRFCWENTPEEVIAGRQHIVNELINKVYLSANEIRHCVDLKVCFDTNQQTLKIVGYIPLYQSRSFDPTKDILLQPFVYNIDKKLISPEVDYTSEEFKQLLLRQQLIYPLHQAAFMHWVPPFYIQWQEDIKNRHEAFHQRTFEILYRINRQDATFLPGYLAQNLQNINLPQLNILIEFIRREYLLREQDLFEILMKICHKLLEDQLVFENSLAMWFIRQTYDIHFHQGGGNKASETLFFELTNKILGKEYHCLANNEDTKYSYESSIYFIMMANEWFKEDKEEFMAIWHKLQPFIERYGKDDHLCVDWIRDYRELVSGK